MYLFISIYLTTFLIIYNYIYICRCIEEECNSRISHQAVLSFSAQAHMGMREYSRAASVLGKDQQSPAAVFFRRLNVGR